MFLWQIVEVEPCSQPDEPERSSNDKGGTPAEADRNEGDQRRRDNRSRRGAGVHQAINERLFFGRIPFGDGFEGGDEAARFSRTEEKPEHRKLQRASSRGVDHVTGRPPSHEYA